MAEHGEMSNSLPAGAKNAESSGIVARQKIGSHGRGGCRPLVGEIVGLQDCPDFAGLGIEQRIGGVDACFGANTHNLYACGVEFFVKARHEKQDAAGEFNLGAYRHAQGGMKVPRKCVANGVNDLIGLGQLTDLVVGKGLHLDGLRDLADGSCEYRFIDLNLNRRSS